MHDYIITFHFRREEPYMVKVRASDMKQALFKFWNLRCQLGLFWNLSANYNHVYEFKKEIKILDVKEGTAA